MGVAYSCIRTVQKASALDIRHSTVFTDTPQCRAISTYVMPPKRCRMKTSCRGLGNCRMICFKQQGLGLVRRRAPFCPGFQRLQIDCPLIGLARESGRARD